MKSDKVMVKNDGVIMLKIPKKSIRNIFRALGIVLIVLLVSFISYKILTYCLIEVPYVYTTNFDAGAEEIVSQIQNRGFVAKLDMNETQNRLQIRVPLRQLQRVVKSDIEIDADDWSLSSWSEGSEDSISIRGFFQVCKSLI